GPAMAVVLIDDAPVARPRPLPIPPIPLPVPQPAPVPPPAPLPPVAPVIEPPPVLSASAGVRPPTADPHVRPVEHREPAGGSVNAASPPGPATNFCGVAAPATARTVVYVIDRSASMGLAGRLERARREVVASLRQLPPSARF